MAHIENKSSRHRHRSPSRERDRERNKKTRDRSCSTEGDQGSDSETSHRHKRSHRHKHKHEKQSEKRSRMKEKSPPISTEQLAFKRQQEKKREKEMQKLTETAEEKRARRLEKKEKKESQRKAQSGWDEEYLGYTNADNPFGDEHMLTSFVWKKKMEKEGRSDMDDAAIAKHQQYKMKESKIELEKVKRRRLEREREWEQREEDKEMMQRDKEADYFREWEEQEDTFHLQQAKLRSKIRIADSRAKPIDLLAQYISLEEDEFAIEMHEPYTYLNGLTIADLDDLLEDIRVYIELEQGGNADYWRDITIIADDEISKLRRLDPDSKEFLGERRSGMNESVSEDVVKVFRGKTLTQLVLLQDSIRQKLDGGEGIDVGYWESLLQQLKAHMARTRLREMHQENLRRKLFKLKEEQCIESAPLFPILKTEESGATEPPTEATPGGSAEEPVASTSSQLKSEPDDLGAPELNDDDVEEEDGVSEEQQSLAAYESGRYSPELIDPTTLELDVLIYDPEDDMKKLSFARTALIKTGQARLDSDDELMKKARAGMTDDEAQFSVEMPLEKHALYWSDKYRPRKPRFFNRVHTGFEWNKYNQTHYDIDNPPPKIVQGYKFNIFYPDLINKSVAPEYSLTPVEDNKDFSLLRFKAGPPYEDIGFKVVNREWECSYKRGFRCQFQNNIFQLWFHFKRYRYRR